MSKILVYCIVWLGKRLHDLLPVESEHRKDSSRPNEPFYSELTDSRFKVTLKDYEQLINRLQHLALLSISIIYAPLKRPQ